MEVEQDWSSNSFFLLFNKFEECIHHKDGDVSFRLSYSEAKSLYWLLEEQLAEYNRIESSYVDYVENRASKEEKLEN